MLSLTICIGGFKDCQRDRSHPVITNCRFVNYKWMIATCKIVVVSVNSLSVFTDTTTTDSFGAAQRKIMQVARSRRVTIQKGITVSKSHFVFDSYSPVATSCESAFCSSMFLIMSAISSSGKTSASKICR